MSSINKFGESLKSHNKISDSVFKKNLFKTLDITVDSNRLDLRKKRISNLTAPIEPKDAVTKAYLNNRTDLLINKIDNVDEKFKNSLHLLQEEINYSLKQNNITILKNIEKVENIQTNSVISISKEIENIKIDLATLKSDILQFTKKQKKENQNIKNDLNAVNKIAFENEKKFNNIENYLFKSLLPKQKKQSETSPINDNDKK